MAPCVDFFSYSQCVFYVGVPARLGDDHLGTVRVEAVPQFPRLQLDACIANSASVDRGFLAGASASSTGGRRLRRHPPSAWVVRRQGVRLPVSEYGRQQAEMGRQQGGGVLRTGSGVGVGVVVQVLAMT